MEPCPSDRELEEHAHEPDPIPRATLEAHLGRCAACAATAQLLRDMLGPETPQEAAALLGLRRSPRSVLRGAVRRAGQTSLVKPPLQRLSRILAQRFRSALIWPALAATAAACGAAALIFSPAAPPEAALAGLAGASRPLEAALSEVPYAPYAPRRGAREEAAFDRPLRILLDAREHRAPGADRALAMLYLVRSGPGDGARADQALLRSGDGADAENDRGVVRYSRGEDAAALDAFDRALLREPRHPAARFNRALVLQRLGLPERASHAFAQLSGTPWEREALERARRLREELAEKPSGQFAGRARRKVQEALSRASTAAELAEAQRSLEEFPRGAAADLVALAGRLSARPPAQLEGRARRWERYLALREAAVAGRLDPGAADAFAAEPLVAGDLLLWAPARQLAGFAHQVRGDWLRAARDDAEIAAGCARRGCAVENEAIALDELADAAGRDGDFAAAHRLQEKAEALLASVAALPQLAELHRKRAALLLEEGRLEQAAAAAALAVRELASAPPTADGMAARSNALAQAAQIAHWLGQPRAAAELGEAALELAQQADLPDVEVDIAAALADVAADRTGLEREIGRLAGRGHQSGEAALRLRLAGLLERAGDAAGAVAEAERGLALSAAGGWSSDRLNLAVVRARGLRALGRDADSASTLSAAVAAAAASARAAPDPVPLVAAAGEAAAEVALSLARAGRPAEELALPLDALRAAAVASEPAAPGWSRSLPQGACVLTILPSARWTLVSLVSREGGDFRIVDLSGEALAALPPDALSAQLFAGLAPRCPASGELWVVAGAPLDHLDLSSLPYEGAALGRSRAVGAATSIARLLAAEPPVLGSALLVREAKVQGDAAGAAVALPASARERLALAKVADVAELAGAAATVEAVFDRAPSAALLHFAVHGFDGPAGGFLLLSGEPGRVGAAEIAQLALRGSPRVVLSACEAASPGPRGLQWAFARAGAVAIAAARDRVDDAAAALWSERFYAALSRGESFARANREALADPRAGWFVVMK